MFELAGKLELVATSNDASVLAALEHARTYHAMRRDFISLPPATCGDDAELRFTPQGQPVARFRIASTPRFRDNATGEWKDGDGLFLTCKVWRQAAENVAERLQRGMRVIVTGRLRQRSYETKEGEKRTVYEVGVDGVGPSLRNATAKVPTATRTTAAQSGGQAHADPGATADPGGFADEPPF